jgi:hypothetical protein
VTGRHAGLHAIGTTLAGRSHITRGVGCEDAFRIAQSADQIWISAVLCDGCGSVPKAAEGADFISTYLSTALLELTARLEREGPGEWVIDAAVVRIAALREAMRSELKGPIGDYAATVIAALVSRQGGFILHIGDGIASSFTATFKLDGELAVSCQSAPKNGEFINQTFYLTGADWIRHIQIIPVSRPSLIMLCTDGAQELLYEGNSPQSNSLSTLLATSLTDAGNGEELLGNALLALDSPSNSGDDLGCVILYAQEIQSLAVAGRLSIFVAPTPPLPTLPPPPASPPPPEFPKPPGGTQPMLLRRFGSRQLQKRSLRGFWIALFISIVIIIFLISAYFVLPEIWSMFWKYIGNVPATMAA